MGLSNLTGGVTQILAEDVAELVDVFLVILIVLQLQLLHGTDTLSTGD
jgi:hypothetical protein